MTKRLDIGAKKKPRIIDISTQVLNIHRIMETFVFSFDFTMTRHMQKREGTEEDWCCVISPHHNTYTYTHIYATTGSVTISKLRLVSKLALPLRSSTG